MATPQQAAEAQGILSKFVQHLKGNAGAYGGGATIAGAGLGTAGLTNAIVNDDLDYLSDDLQSGLLDPLDADPVLSSAYRHVFEGREMTGADRLVATMMLEKGTPKDGKIVADTEGGAAAIKAALEVRQANPEIALKLQAVATDQGRLIWDQRQAGVSSREVSAANESGAGVNSLIPSLMGVAGAGAMGYGAHRHMNR